MKNSLILMSVGLTFLFCGFLAAEYLILNHWLLLVPIGGLAIFISGTLKFLKNFENGS
jgi:hypothetical protein